MPASVGGQGCTALQQVLVQEQGGRVTNGVGLGLRDAAVVVAPRSPTTTSARRWLLPDGPRRDGGVLRDHRGGRRAPTSPTSTATARRDGDEYVLDGVKWHVTSFNEADYVFFQAVLTDGPHAGEQALFVVDIDTPGVRVVRTPAYTHTLGHAHPIVAFEDVRVPATHLVGNEGDGMTFAYEWFRFERLMVAARCLGAAERLVDEMTAFAQQRIVGGQPLIERQLVQAMLADSLTELFAARSMVVRDRALDRRGRRPRRCCTPAARW